jgi:2'-5' RNA ligase
MQTLPLILTLKLDPLTFEYVNHLRQQYFPETRNFLPAHVTLFHTLPGDQEKEICQSLQSLCSKTPRMHLCLPAVRFLGRGVAIAIHSPALVQLRQTLETSWSEWLSNQDRQGYRPHITIQNKVTPAEAREHGNCTKNWKENGNLLMALGRDWCFGTTGVDRGS